MKEKRISGLTYLVELIHRYRKGTATSKERAILERWVPDERMVNAYPQDNPLIDACTERVWRRLEKQIHRKKSRCQYVKLSVWRNVAAAAAIVLLVGGGWFAYRGLNGAVGQSQTLLAEAPRRAWTTDDGHRLTLTLPDGSKVKVNADSRLEIAEAAFNKEKREVWLTGEAFFEVAKNPDKPFIIHTGAMQTTVRGTSFNVKAYAELGENVVSVRDGKVEITEGERQLALLTANRQLKYATESKQAEVSDADWRDAAGWTEGRLVLNGANAAELKLRLHQQFGVEVNIESGALDGTSVAGSFSKERTLQEVLHTIGTVYNIQYEITGTHVIIKPR